MCKYTDNEAVLIFRLTRKKKHRCHHYETLKTNMGRLATVAESIVVI